ncbi:amidohydrolase [Paraglaciecola sp. L3A3]|uniref:amidohydrolase family protein n=1 Tax=Paraglaciecola sp. L3A3 TaxID=2686358 RepID=UPI00131B8CD0|nr:amidohydrolase family protein [Paraglaciecola sp. L3A3]
MNDRTKITKPIRLDSHRLVWQHGPDYYNWLTEDMYQAPVNIQAEKLIKRNHLPGISKIILVQAVANIEQTKYLLRLAHLNDSIVGVIACIDMYSPDAIRDIARLAIDPYFKGIRPKLQNSAESDWMLAAKFEPIFNCLSNFGLSFDALVKPRHLEALLVIINRFPELKIAIDHIVKPNVTMRHFETWAENIFQISSHSHVFCKLTGLIEGSHHNANLEPVIPYMQHLIESFGAKKLMWGSDWSVLNLATDYKQWLGLTEAFLSSMTEDEKHNIWSLAASDFYNIKHDILKPQHLMEAC